MNVITIYILGHKIHLPSLWSYIWKENVKKTVPFSSKLVKQRYALHGSWSFQIWEGLTGFSNLFVSGISPELKTASPAKFNYSLNVYCFRQKRCTTRNWSHLRFYSYRGKSLLVPRCDGMAGVERNTGIWFMGTQMLCVETNHPLHQLCFTKCLIEKTQK